MENQVSRKEFLKKALTAAGVLLGGSALISSCGSNESSAPAEPAAPAEQPKSMVDQPAASGDCTDVSSVSPDEIKKREAVQYHEKSEDPAKHCKDCQLYKQPEAAGGCGGCTLFAGPVTPDGSCISFAPKAA
ncbi:MAG TPA: high-potential iron-sulfur protein [Niabella sp.]|jgi:hypothetical protein|nr:high-potential iron-sulfur protein [Chitinophagaceae bacterium]HRN48828.1 high-potential iron-sulfur protein [Niabella sp.]HRO84575.1 high-potential iron-sulfur protein [Niabella sp.]HUN01492.1 high-potential iron-sulfur protein [Niabella sp.]